MATHHKAGDNAYSPTWAGLDWEDDHSAYPHSAARLASISDQLKGLTARVEADPFDPHYHSTGILVPPEADNYSYSNILVASRAYIIRFIPRKSCTITKMAFALLTSATNDDHCDVGILSADLATLLSSSGDTAGKLNAGNNTIQTLNLQAGVPLVGGTVYYGAFACGTVGGTAAYVGMTNMQSAVTQIMGATIPNISQSFHATAFPLTAPFAYSGALAMVPVLGLLY